MLPLHTKWGTMAVSASHILHRNISPLRKSEGVLLQSLK